MLYLLYGDSAPLQIKYEELLQKIKNENPGIKIKFFDGNEDLESFFTSASSTSMFAKTEVLVLKRAEDIKKLDNTLKTLGKFNTSSKEIIILYEEFLNDYGKRTNEISTKNIKIMKDLGRCVGYRDEKNTVLLYIQELLNISQNEAQALIDLIGNDFFIIKNEIEKINSFLDGERYSLEKVRPILSINHEANLKKLIEAYLLAGEKENLINYLKQENMYMLFLYSLAEELMTYLKLRLLVDDGEINKRASYNAFKGEPYEKIKIYFKNSRGFVHQYPLFLKLKNIDLFNANTIKKKLNSLITIEYRMKSGIGDVALDCELFILKS